LGVLFSPFFHLLFTIYGLYQSIKSDKIYLLKATVLGIVQKSVALARTLYELLLV